MFPSRSRPSRRKGVKVKPRTLGSTGYLVSELGFGGWGLGGSQWRGVDDGQGRDALRAAVDRGITFFDTALAYGEERDPSRSEEHTSELQSLAYLVCRLLLEKKKKKYINKTLTMITRQ